MLNSYSFQGYCDFEARMGYNKKNTNNQPNTKKKRERGKRVKVTCNEQFVRVKEAEKFMKILLKNMWIKYF